MEPSLSLNKPMSQSQFYRLSRNDQVKYVSSLVSTYGASGTMIAEMLNMSGVTLRNHMATLGYHFSKGGRRSSEQLDEWEIFCNDDNKRSLDTGSIIYIDQSPASDPVEDKTDDSVESMKMFIEECCKLNDDMNTRVDIFIQVYLAWCRDNEFPPMRKDEIINFITKEYNTTFPKKCGHVYCNICLNYEKFQMYKNKIKYHAGEDKKTINPYMTFAKEKEIVKDTPEPKKVYKTYTPKKEVVEDKPVNKISDKTFKQTHANGEYEFEGNSKDILNYVASVIDNCNMRIRIVWELI